MRTPTLGLQTFRLKYFKAVRDSGEVRFTPLTVFIGNNGSGKSSIVEGLETFQMIATQGVNNAIQYWGGFDQIVNKAVSHKPVENAGKQVRPYYVNPMSFDLNGTLTNRAKIEASIQITKEPIKDTLFIKREKLVQSGQNISAFNFKRNDFGQVTGDYSIDGVKRSLDIPDLVGNTSLLHLQLPGFPSDTFLKSFITDWQFLRLTPDRMGNIMPRSHIGEQIKLAKDGSNIAEYLLHIRDTSPQIFQSIVETLQVILPYAEDLQVALTSELERTLYLELTEGDFKIPGWLLSTGTLRLVALLALLRHPDPPPLIVIEEIENGLDPNSVHLIVDEIHRVIELGRTQIIFTTHSPYLLDLLSLDHIVLVERIEGQATFTRPGDDENLHRWAKRFSPGRLYTTNKLSREARG